MTTYWELLIRLRHTILGVIQLASEFHLLDTGETNYIRLCCTISIYGEGQGCSVLDLY